MNSKILQDKVQEIADEAKDMRLLRRSEKNLENLHDGKEKAIMCSSQSTVSLKHYDQLICDLRCPGCTALLQAPIYLCFNGHSICRLCRMSVKICPACDGELSNIRSQTLERLSGKFQFPCKNLRNGCMVRLPLELMKWHEDKCVYKKTACFMGKIWHDCDWRGRENEWLSHCKTKHSQKILENKDSSELVWSFETLKDNAGPIIAYFLLLNYGETFNLYQIHEAKHSTLTWTVILANHHLSSNEESDKYKSPSLLPKFSFEFEFYNKNDPNYLLIQRFPVHYEDSEDVLDDGKCVKVSLNDVQRFLDGDKNLFYRVKIISGKGKNNVRKDRWDQLLEEPITHQHENYSEDDDFFKQEEFAYFDSTDDGEDKVFMDDEKLAVVISDKHYYERRNDDLIKKTFDKEFSPMNHSHESLKSQKPPMNHSHESLKIQKPPRKSLENRKSLELNASNYTLRQF